MPLPPRIALAALATLVFAAPLRAADTPRFYRAPATAQHDLPFSDAVRAGNLLFLSGQIGNLPGTTTLAPGGITAEAKQAMENIRAILAASGASMDDVVKCTAFLADIKDWPAFNAVYRGYFKAHLPARSAMAASGLALGARVEVECIAATGR
ncbi:MAG: Rid family detoxifying hydrolase [Mizugakiibacter sp.]|uniref:RidA family protein n=1 Tax=Mizugakiibacter sp. TaxID=1972610 RepID=UPI0031BF3203|nr:Rid family detoxifying hydrolase [Xanthomonadaceae bacterium]